MPDALMVTSSFLPGRGGIETYLAELCDSVAPRVAVMAAAARDGRPLPDDLRYQTLAGPGSMLWPGARLLQSVLRTAEDLEVDRILFGTPWPLVLLGPALRKQGLRYASLGHGAELFVPGAIPGLGKRLAMSLSQADVLLPVSDYTATRIQSLLVRHGLTVPPIERLYARIDQRRFAPGPETDAAPGPGWGEGPVILCFGRLVRRKGVHRLIGAMPEVEKSVPGATLVVAGTGPQQRRLERLAARVQGRVLFLGHVGEREVPRLYARADVFALPVVNRWFGLEVEGLGVVLLEASASGTPCVTGRSGGTAEAVIDGSTGFVLDARDSGALIEKIVWVLTHPSEATRMGLQARAHVVENFSSQHPPEPLVEWLG